MLEHSKNPKRLTVAFFIFVFILIVGLITIKRPNLIYRESPYTMVETILSMSDEITPEEAQYLAESDPKCVFIDIRNPYDYIKGHLPNAVNIPLNNLINEEYLNKIDSYLQDSMTVVLYGNDQTQANGPWMILKQIGYKNVKVMLGGYNYLSKKPSGDTEDVPAYYVEDPRYDFAQIVKETETGQVQKTQTNKKSIPVVPKRRKKKTAVSGGC